MWDRAGLDWSHELFSTSGTFGVQGVSEAQGLQSEQTREPPCLAGSLGSPAGAAAFPALTVSPQVPASALEMDGDAVLQDLVGIREQASKADLAQTSVAGGSYE